MTPHRNALDALVDSLVDRRVKFIFGVPGGDCSLDVIDAAARAGIRYILARTENAAGISAAVTAELTGSIGVVMTTRGPGLASGVNGVAYAHLDRSPLLLIADNYDDDLGYVSHQRFDQAAVLRPLLRADARMDGVGDPADLEALLDSAWGQPNGPVYLEVTNKGVNAPAPGRPIGRRNAPSVAPPDAEALAAAGDRIANARRPLVIAGFQACEDSAARGLRSLAERWQVPVYTTYRAKGAMPDNHPLLIGHYIGGVAEEPAIAEADLIVLYGFDAVEFPPGRWRYDVPVVELTRHGFDRRLVEPAVSVVGDLASASQYLLERVGTTEWDHAALAKTKRELLKLADASGEGPISPQMVVDAAQKAAPDDARIALDAGAHMIPVLHHWICQEPRQTLLSRGLATMGFAVPAALASCLVDPNRRAIAFTGDGGMMMCAGELGTAAQYGCNPVVVVFNDSTLTLIGAKQERRQLPNNGVDFSPTNFAAIASGFGCDHHRVEHPEELDAAFAAAFASERPALVDVKVNPRAYHRQLISLRG